MARQVSRTFIAFLGLVALLVMLSVGVQAQSTPTVTVEAVDTSAFPEVLLSVRALDGNQVPMAGLSTQDFSLFEDGSPIPAERLTVSGDTSRPLRLIFAIDSSLTPQTMDALKGSMKSFVSTLAAQDQVALLMHPLTGSEGFTSNPTLLGSQIDRWAVAVTPTSLRDTVSSAIEVARSVPPGQSVVIFVTDGWDGNERFPDTVTTEAIAAQVPLYGITLGSGQSGATSVQGMAQQSGGQAYILSGVPELSSTLQQLLPPLRQRYQVRYTSALPADGGMHSLTVGVSYQGIRTLGTESFTVPQGAATSAPPPSAPSQEAPPPAQASGLTVRIVGLQEGQQVSGIVPLSVQASGPLPIVSVEYRLDSLLVEQVKRAPYEWEWDSSVLNAGPHTLSVRAIDEGGNTAEQSLTLQVVAPIQVQASLSAEEVRIGQSVTIEAQVESLTSISQVDFLLDGSTLGSDSTAPYGFTFDTSRYRAGTHNIIVRAQDPLGNSDEALLSIQFVAATSWNWGRYLGWLLLLLLGGGLIWLLFRFLKGRRKGGLKHCYLEIQNLGNAPSRYELRAETADENLTFQFALAGEPLLQRQETSRAGSGVAARSVTPTAPTPASDEGGYSPSGLERSTASLSFASRAADAVAEVLSAVSYFLPGEIRMTTMRMAGELRKGRQTAAIAGRLPGNLGRLATNVRGEKEMPKRSQQRAAAPAVGNGLGNGSPAVMQAEGSYAKTWAQTPVVEPGETLVLDLFVEAIRPNASNVYPFQLVSKSVEQEGAPLVVEQVTVEMSKPTWFRR